MPCFFHSFDLLSSITELNGDFTYAYLRDVAGLFQSTQHHNKVSHMTFFGYLVHIKVMIILYWSMFCAK
jgi:hypothetical protein